MKIWREKELEKAEENVKPPQGLTEILVVYYFFSIHKKRHTMTSVKTVQRDITVYAYRG